MIAKVGAAARDRKRAELVMVLITSISRADQFDRRTGSSLSRMGRGRKIHQIDPETGAVLRTIESNRVVTGVTWVESELWHGTWEGDESDLRRVDPRTGEVLERLEMPPGVGVSGLESDGGERFYCGGGSSGKVRAVRRPGRGSTAKPRK